MPSDIAILVRNLTKTYRLFDHPGDRIKQALTFGRVKFHREFTALRDVSFDIKKGETVGIIGRNGSGKSTLLQLICGILKPTSGSVTVNGKVSALLELGSGFNPEFTGRENIYFQGAIMGFTREEIEAKVDDIIAFADIGEFIDQPVRTYSSGMFVRLAFATAIHSEPDILVVDEALAVGDITFQQKCHEYFEHARKKGMTLLLVAHDMLLIRALCDKAVLLSKGSVEAESDPEDVTERYIKSSSLTTPLKFHECPVNEWRGKADIPNMNRDGEIVSVVLKNADDNRCQFKPGENLQIELVARIRARVEVAQFIVNVKDKRGYVLFGTRSELAASMQHIEDGWRLVSASLSLKANLGSGQYGVLISLTEGTGSAAPMLDRVVDAITISVDSDKQNFQGIVDLEGRWENYPEASLNE